MKCEWNAHEKYCTGYNKESKTILMQYTDNEMGHHVLLKSSLLYFLGKQKWNKGEIAGPSIQTRILFL